MMRGEPKNMADIMGIASLPFTTSIIILILILLVFVDISKLHLLWFCPLISIFFEFTRGKRAADITHPNPFKNTEEKDENNEYVTKKYGMGTVAIVLYVLSVFLDMNNFGSISIIFGKVIDIGLGSILSIYFITWLYKTIQKYRKKKVNKKVVHRIKIFFLILGSILIMGIFSSIFIAAKNYNYEGDSAEFFLEVKGRDVPIVFSSKVFDVLDTSRSSFIKVAAYDSSEEYLIISMSDANYQYCNIPSYIWSNFSTAESFGEYYNSNIRSEYGCESSSEPKYLGVDCLDLAIQAQEKYLMENGYNKQKDGSYMNADGDYPYDKVGDKSEEISNDVYFSCLQ